MGRRWPGQRGGVRRARGAACLDAGADLVQIHGASARHRWWWIDRAVAALCPEAPRSRSVSFSTPPRAQAWQPSRSGWRACAEGAAAQAASNVSQACMPSRASAIAFVLHVGARVALDDRQPRHSTCQGEGLLRQAGLDLAQPAALAQHQLGDAALLALPARASTCASR